MLCTWFFCLSRRTFDIFPYGIPSWTTSASVQSGGRLLMWTTRDGPLGEFCSSFTCNNKESCYKNHFESMKLQVAKCLGWGILKQDTAISNTKAYSNQTKILLQPNQNQSLTPTESKTKSYAHQTLLLEMFLNWGNTYSN